MFKPDNPHEYSKILMHRMLRWYGYHLQTEDINDLHQTIAAKIATNELPSKSYAYAIARYETIKFVQKRHKQWVAEKEYNYLKDCDLEPLELPIEILVRLFETDTCGGERGVKTARNMALICHMLLNGNPTNQQIADELGCGIRNVKKYRTRIKRILRERIENNV